MPPFETISPQYYVTGGTLPPDAPSYVSRKADEDLYANLLKGEYCYVLNTRQMGKSSLMARTARRLRDASVSVLILDLQKYGRNLTPSQWYRGLLDDLVDRLGLPETAIDYWSDNREIGPLNRLLNIIRDFVLTSRDQPLVIFIDEIDYVLSLPFSADEFFAGIRDCYNRRSEDPSYQKLTFCLLGVATPSDLIRDSRTTPFNIGKRIDLHDFTTEEAAPLAIGLAANKNHLPANVGNILLARVLYWTGGHPNLTQRFCLAVSERKELSTTGDVDALCEQLFLSEKARESDDNLAFVRNYILNNPENRVGLLELYHNVWVAKQVRNDETNPLMEPLLLSGIVRSEKGRLRVRNRIYQQVFDRKWILDHMPDAELQRQRAAYRRGMVRALSLASVILLAMAGLVVFAMEKAFEAEAKQKELITKTIEAENNSRAAEKNRYAAVHSRNEAEAKQKEIIEAKSKITKTNHELKRTNASLESKKKAVIAANAMLHDTNYKLENKTMAAQKAAESEALQRRRTETALYPNLITLANRALELGDLAGANKFLDRSKRDIRGFEWAYLKQRASDNSIQTVQAHKTGDRIKAMAMSPDGSHLATSGINYTFSIWNPKTGKKTADLGNGEEVWSLAFSSKDDLLASGANGKVSFWNPDSGRQVNAISNLYPRPLDGSDTKYFVLSMAWSPNQRTLALGLRRGFIRFWDRDTNRLSDAYIQDTDCNMACLAFSPDGSLLARGSQYNANDDAVRLWDPVTHKEKKRIALPVRYKGKSPWIHSLSFSPDGKYLLAGGGDGTLFMWNLENSLSSAPSPIIIKDHNASINTLAFSPDSKLLATGSADKTINIWDVERLKEGANPILVATLLGHSGPVTSAVFLPDGKTLISGGEDGTLRYWDRDHFRPPLRAYKGEGVNNLEYSRDGSRFITSNGKNEVTVFDSLTRKSLGSYQGADDFYLRAALSPDGKTVAMAHSLSIPNQSPPVYVARLSLWSVTKQAIIGEFTGTMEGRECIAFSPDGSLLATGSRDNSASSKAGNPAFFARIWDVASMKETAAFPAHRGWVQCLAFSPDGHTLATGGGEHNIRLWDIVHRKELASLPDAHDNYLICIVFSPKGDMLASCSPDDPVKLWRLSSEHNKIMPVASLFGHLKKVNAISFSHDGGTLASGDDDGIMKLWFLRTTDSDHFQEEVSIDTKSYGTKYITRLAFSPVGHKLAIGGYSGQVLFLEGETKRPSAHTNSARHKNSQVSQHPGTESR